MNTENNKHSSESIIPTSLTGSDSEGKVGTKRKRFNSRSRSKRHEDVPWTAVRCNRLLRAITSRIIILRRLSENNFADKAAARKSPARQKTGLFPTSERRVSPDAVDKLGARLAALPALESPTKGNDPEWIPESGRKSVKRTYTGRGRPRKVKIGQPAESKRADAGFRSPFIKRILRPEAADSPLNLRTCGTPSRSRQIKLQPNSHAERALGTLLESFESLLIATTPPTAPHRHGAGPLRDMCLRRVPDYVDFEQRWAEDEEEDYDFDATKAIYLELEKLGDGGWSGLREVVRAHAVKLVADSMDDRTWPLESLDSLLDMCARNSAIPEGQRILRAWFLKSEGRATNRLERLLECSSHLDSPGFMFRTLLELLNRSMLRDSDLLECPRIWQELLKALARRSSRADAVSFFEAYAVACIHKDCDPTATTDAQCQVRMKRNEVLRNILVLVTALCWTEGVETESVEGMHSLSPHLHQMAISGCQASDQCNGLVRTHQEENIRPAIVSVEPFLMGSVVSHAMNVDNIANTDMVGFESLAQVLVEIDLVTNQLPDRKKIIAERADFVCEIAKCVAHMDQRVAKDMIKDVTTGLLVSSKRVPTAATSLKKLAVDIAMAWAEYQGDNESYVFAEDIENAGFTGSPRGDAVHTPSSSRKPKRYRWEAGICEWIKATPLASTTKESAFMDVLVSENDSGIGIDAPESPLKNQFSRAMTQVEKVTKEEPCNTREVKPIPSVRSLVKPIKAEPEPTDDQPLMLLNEAAMPDLVMKSSTGTAPTQPLATMWSTPNTEPPENSPMVVIKSIGKVEPDICMDLPATPIKEQVLRRSESPMKVESTLVADLPTEPMKTAKNAKQEPRSGADTQQLESPAKDELALTSGSPRKTQSRPIAKQLKESTKLAKVSTRKADTELNIRPPASPTKDELAMTPRPARSSPEARTRGPKTESPHHKEPVERDELAMSPELQRKSRQPRPAKSRRVTRAAEKRKTATDMVKTRIELPLRPRATRSRSKQVDASDDELGV